MTTLLEKPEVEEVSNGDRDLFHWFCGLCYPDCNVECVSLCGKDIAGDEYLPDGPEEVDVECVVCVDLIKAPCARGHTVT